MNKGILYGVSVGPGESELMTLKAARILKECPVIVAPATMQGGTLALDIARGAVDLSDKHIEQVVFAMTTDKEKAAEHHRMAAQQIIVHLERGQDVAMLNLGDISLYSTFGYILPIVQDAGHQVEVVPGVTSFCAAAARLKVSLTDMERPLHILPAGHMDMEDGLSLPGTKVLMKSGKSFHRVRRALGARGVTAPMVENCGLPGERVYEDVGQAEDAGYFSIILVKD